MRKFVIQSLILSVLTLGRAQADDWKPIDTKCSDYFGEDRFSIYGSLLYWKPYCDEFEYAVQRSTFDTKYFDKAHTITGSFDCGFRLGFDVDMNCPGWLFSLEWTHYDNTSRHGKTLFQPSDADFSLVAIPWVQYSEDFFSDAEEQSHFKTKHEYHYDTVDFDVARWFCRKEGLSFKPFFGFRAARFEERFQSSYVMSVSGNNAFAEAKNLFKGYGLRAGMDMEWNIPWNFTLFAKAAGSILWGKTKLNHDDTVNDVETTETWNSDLKETSREGRYIAELALGVRWVSQFCYLHPLFFELSFDQTYLFDQHRFFTSQIIGTTPTQQTKLNGDVLLQGVSLTIGMDF
jgi:hypothetical protein